MTRFFKIKTKINPEDDDPNVSKKMMKSNFKESVFQAGPVIKNMGYISYCMCCISK